MNVLKFNRIIFLCTVSYIEMFAFPSGGGSSGGSLESGSSSKYSDVLKKAVDIETNSTLMQEATVEYFKKYKLISLEYSMYKHETFIVEKIKKVTE